MQDNQSLGLANIYSLIAEMRTPLAELKILNQRGDLEASAEVAKQTLELFNSFLYAQKLEGKDANLRPAPHSLVAATENVLDKIYPFAKLYGVNLEFKAGSLKNCNVSLIRQAFDHATHSLLHSLISSLQNTRSARLKIRVVNQGTPTLRFFSSDVDAFFKDKSVFDSFAKLKLNAHCAGLSSGLLLANLIYHQMGSKLNFIANQHGQGLWINFKPTRQMSLMESLN